MTSLLDIYQLGDLSLKNRVVLAPMTRARTGDDRVPTSLMVKYYCQRANAGLIITEATVVSEIGIGWNNTPGIYNDAQVQAWKAIVQGIHHAGSKVFLQLWHCGRASHQSFHPHLGLPVAPSAIAINGDYIHTPDGKQAHQTPRPLTVQEITATVEDYRQAAVRAKEAGFDGVEIHGANGYLIDEFLQSKTNQRNDAYGGSLENRFRFLQEVTEAVLTVFPSQRVGVRLSPNGVFNDMGSPDYREAFPYFAQRLNVYNLGYLHIVDGLAFGFHNLGEPLTLADFRAVYSGTLMGNCGYTQATAETAIVEGSADLIAFGRPYISNPDLVQRFANGWALAPDPDPKVWNGTEGNYSAGYTDFPTYLSQS
ncbi:alkene reductase [Synechocystis sp. FACHB-383]|uniref:alkene reductase n=1 Tax=Synechocystis sp. FACHB-383 TaxID=2692864 RepID=UPI00168705C4|nr:alkene reductase [Synechocystis sp. FACHB-383]MBD2655449.1 alkene reductase [Synechocystis sp. FACHB-383]